MFRKKVYLFSLLLLCIIALTACASTQTAQQTTTSPTVTYATLNGPCTVTAAAQLAPEVYESIDEYLQDAEVKAVSEIFLPVQVPYDAEVYRIISRPDSYLSFEYSVFDSDKTGYDQKAIYTQHLGDAKGNLESVVFDNIEIYTELTHNGQTFYYNYDYAREEVSGVAMHCFCFVHDGHFFSVAIPAKASPEAKDILSIEKALTYLELEPIKLD
ncbi:MAG: hypothetical protein E7463_01040 [Ruminococcaceae bacterium]|nr:hypothetical protein [Oscillospiraceae bacterium]